MKKIIQSSLMLVAVAAIVAGGTGAFFSDTEVSAGNVFTAGTIDLTIDHTAASYNGENCVIDCSPIGSNLVANGSFEEPVATANGGSYEFFAAIPDWTLEAGSVIEVQRNAFASADGQQHVELDGDEPNPATTISQSIVTVPGERYRLSFAHSPRPQNNAANSGIRLEVAVVSPGGTTFSDTITTGSGPVSWSTYTYEFIADDVTTTIRFAYDGTVNTFGGLLDNVQVLELECEGGVYEDTPGGFCELWEATDLTTEKFFNFSDIKPQDSGSNLISMHVESNESYLCLAVNNQEEQEGSHTDPEVTAGDNTGGTLEGEMGSFLTVAGWYSDENGNKLGPLFGPTAAADLDSIAYSDSTTGNGPVAPEDTQYAHLEWCMGDMTVSGNDVTCDGNVPDINQTQTDAFLADLQFYAIQTRNNENFECSQAEFPGGEDNGGSEPETETISIDSSEDYDVFGDFTESTLGLGSWKNDSDSGDKTFAWVYWQDTPGVLGSFTIDDIESITYKTNKDGAQGDVDFYYTIYTLEDGVDDTDTWYGYRLNMEPYFSNNLNAPANTWNTWSTDSGVNESTFFDSAKIGGGFGFYGQPTLADIQGGTINWNSFNGSYTNQPIDYGAETVKGIALQTGSGWDFDLEGYVDEFVIELKDGTVQTIDLEPAEVN